MLRYNSKELNKHAKPCIPLTRLNSTQPPAASILFVSSSLFGLWSKESSSTRPDTLATARESPTLPWQKKHNIRFNVHDSTTSMNSTRVIEKSKIHSLLPQTVRSPFINHLNLSRCKKVSKVKFIDVLNDNKMPNFRRMEWGPGEWKAQVLSINKTHSIILL